MVPGITEYLFTAVLFYIVFRTGLHGDDLIFIDSLQNKGIRTIILSGGIKYLANKWAKKWNIDEVIANDLIDDDRGQLCAIIE